MTVTPMRGPIYQNQGNGRSMQLTSSLAKLPRALARVSKPTREIQGILATLITLTLRLVAVRVAASRVARAGPLPKSAVRAENE